MRVVCGWTEGVESGASVFGHENVFAYILGSLEYFMIIKGHLVSLTGREWWTRRARSLECKRPSRRSVRLKRV